MTTYNHYLITAVQRSATRYAAYAMSSIGLRCGHEVVFDTRMWPEIGDWDRWLGSATGHGGLWLDYLPSDVYVVHQVRNPLRCIDSWEKIGWLTPRAEHRFPKGYIDMILSEYPELLEIDSHLARIARFYVLWNRRIEQSAHMRIRVEDYGCDFYRHMLNLFNKSHGDIDNARLVPKSLNELMSFMRTPIATEPADLARIPDRYSWIRDDFVEMVTRYGYGDIQSNSDTQIAQSSCT